jgi:hypothetical protein
MTKSEARKILIKQKCCAGVNCNDCPLNRKVKTQGCYNRIQRMVQREKRKHARQK